MSPVEYIAKYGSLSDILDFFIIDAKAHALRSDRIGFNVFGFDESGKMHAFQDISQSDAMGFASSITEMQQAFAAKHITHYAIICEQLNEYADDDLSTALSVLVSDGATNIRAQMPIVRNSLGMISDIESGYQKSNVQSIFSEVLDVPINYGLRAEGMDDPQAHYRH